MKFTICPGTVSEDIETSEDAWPLATKSSMEESKETGQSTELWLYPRGDTETEKGHWGQTKEIWIESILVNNNVSVLRPWLWQMQNTNVRYEWQETRCADFEGTGNPCKFL